jgi:hypothetical protein
MQEPTSPPPHHVAPETRNPDALARARASNAHEKEAPGFRRADQRLLPMALKLLTGRIGR